MQLTPTPRAGWDILSTPLAPSSTRLRKPRLCPTASISSTSTVRIVWMSTTLPLSQCTFVSLRSSLQVESLQCRCYICVVEGRRIQVSCRVLTIWTATCLDLPISPCYRRVLWPLSISFVSLVDLTEKLALTFGRNKVRQGDHQERDLLGEECDYSTRCGCVCGQCFF